jgi:hypothetical protein
MQPVATTGISSGKGKVDKLSVIDILPDIEIPQR